MSHSTYRLPLLASVLLALAGSAQAQQFSDNTSDIPSGSPGNNSQTENIDFGDVDNDGDWDAVLADGGDNNLDQNRIWINLGNLQGGTTGDFADQTSTRFPSRNDQSRDIEFADIDNDGDIDIYVSNTSEVQNDTNRWLVNRGGLQASTIGFYQDETAARWLNIGSNGPHGQSSINAGFVQGAGGFTDWSCDCDFGDLDNDGDLDLVHSSYGGAFGGDVPTRIFLNDGAGFFSELNPSNFTVGASGDINNGNPGIWCEGTQSANTTNSTGVNCDIASSALDIDVGDIDGDFDLDILHGARQEAPRMFANRLDGSGLAPASGGGLLFRDVTGMVFPGGYTSGNGHYEQEMGDLDGDGDLDIYGLNWLASGGFTDITLRNDGAGTYSGQVSLPGSGSDDNEGDFLDYDNDGDLDLFVCNFSGGDKMYRNNNNGGASFSYTGPVSGVLPGGSSFTGLDADACDVDGDGDYDLMVGNDNGARNQYLKNGTSANDTHAPYIPNVEQAPNRSPGPAPTVVRAHVYDNAPYYITWYNNTWVEVHVNGGPAQIFSARSSAGQVFRCEIPGGLSGAITYQFFSEDEYGNQGSSSIKSYSSGGGGFPDCNNNGVDDAVDIAGGASQDCNNNATPDECETGDCDNDGILDECEPDCDNDGTPDDCESDCDNDGTPDDCESDCDNDGTPDDCESDCDSDGTPDDCEPDCDNDGTPDDCEVDCNNNGIPDECDFFVDCNFNGIPDECEPDCDNDGQPDGCEVDCNNNGTPDVCESFADCNSNGTPDDCEADCDNDGTPDDCEPDCDNNGTPDDCESQGDCNNNGIPDNCESLSDCDSDGTPDVCEADCDSDGTPDDCEVDCDNNGVPDDCDVFADCNANNIPDDCEADCNSNFQPDSCDISAGSSQDCDVNGIPDECDLAGGAPDCNNNGVPDGCDIASGGSFDGNNNGVPDECEVDCNNNGVNDTVDIQSGTSVDTNSNGIPDECEAIQNAFGFCVVGPCGNDFPTAGCLNSTGSGATILATGSSSVSADDLFLTMQSLSTNEFGIFFSGPLAGAGFAFGDGRRVVVGSLNRFPILNSGPAGSISFGPVVGHANTFFPVAGHIVAGSDWHFQGWFRDPQGPCSTSFNLTHGLTISFTP